MLEATALESHDTTVTAFKYEAAYARKLYFSSRKELLESDTPFDMAHVTAMQAVVNMARRLHGEHWEEVMQGHHRTVGKFQRALDVPRGAAVSSARCARVACPARQRVAGWGRHRAAFCC